MQYFTSLAPKVLASKYKYYQIMVALHHKSTEYFDSSKIFPSYFKNMIAICETLYYIIINVTHGGSNLSKTKEHRSNKIGIEGIGRLEAEIMSVVWTFEREVTVREVYEAMREKKSIAYTTIMTVMNNLAEKGLLLQDKAATAYVYKPTKTSVDVAISIVKTVVDKILQGSAEPLASYFAEKK